RMTPLPGTRRPFARLAAAAAVATMLLAGCTEGAAPGEDAPAGGEASDAGGAGEDAADGGPSLEATGTSAAGDPPADPAAAPDGEADCAQRVGGGPGEDVDAEGAECGTITVPLVWNDPEAGDIEIAVGRLAADGESKGSLVTNPGGPGGSGVNFLPSA